jgi:hypothetical protein
MTSNFSGGCLCGAVTYQGEGAAPASVHCQCIDCRKSSGTGHGSHMAMPETAVQISGAMTSYDRAADSGNIVSRSFCPRCGCAICSTNSSMPGLMFLRASSLDDPERFDPQMVVYGRSGASWDLLDPSLPVFETMPPPDAVPL